MVLSPFTRLIGLGVPGALFFLVVSLAAQRLHEILGFQFQFHPADFGQVFFRSKAGLQGWKKHPCLLELVSLNEESQRSLTANDLAY